MTAEPAEATLIHQGGVYRSDLEFLAMAMPFIEDGIAAGEAVLAATTAANLELLRDALGERADLMDYAETAYFGRRPPQRVAAFHRYWQSAVTRGSGRHVRILAEPVWGGRSRRDILAWKRMESSLNLVLAGTNIWMICPYDSRTAPADVMRAALRTHPERVDGPRAVPSPDYVDPYYFTAQCDAEPLQPSPADAVRRDIVSDPLGFRGFFSSQAEATELPESQRTLFLVAAHEAYTYLAQRGDGPATVRVWTHADNLICQIDQPGATIGDPMLGLRPPGGDPFGEQGMWLTQQICDHVDLRDAAGGATIRLHFPNRHVAELLPSSAAMS